MGQSWYYSHGSDQLGPVTLDELKLLIQNRRIELNNLVWSEGMEDWAPAGSIPELAVNLAPQATAAPTFAPPPPSAPAPHFAAWPQQAMPAGVLGYASAPPQYQVYAGFWNRFAAVFLDGILLYIVGMLTHIAIFAVMGLSYFDYFPNNPPGRVPMEVSLGKLIGWMVGVVVGWLYFALQESSAKQATLGKRACGIMVTDLNGQRLSFGRATGRYFAKLISDFTILIGYMLAGWTAKKQALHDMLAGTLVIKGKAESAL